MEIPNNKTGVPMAHYKSLYRELDPHAAAARCGIGYDEASSEFTLNHFSEPICVGYPEFRLYYKRGGEPLPDTMEILIIRFIIEGAGGRGSGKFLSYAEVPWGETYLTNFKGRCIARLAHGFGYDVGRFKRACAALGGRPASGGDASFDLEFLEGFTLRVIIWAGDDEFPPNAQILFSDNFPLAFTAEDLAAVGDMMINALKRTK